MWHPYFSVSVRSVESQQIPTPVLARFSTSDMILQVTLGIQTSLKVCPIKIILDVAAWVCVFILWLF